MLYKPVDGSKTNSDEYTCPDGFGAAVDDGTFCNLGVVFGTGLGDCESTLLSCWNLWNSDSKSRLPRVIDRGTGDTVDGRNAGRGVTDICFVYNEDGLGVTATCNNWGLYVVAGSSVWVVGTV